MIKFVRLCRISFRLTLFIQTLHNAAKELESFLVMFSAIFMAFLCLFYLLFVSKMFECSNLLSTAQMLFEITLMKFDATEISGADAFLGPFCFTLFILIVVFICFSVFLSIINDNFRLARENQSEDEEMLLFMIKKFIRWTGLKKATATEIQEQKDIQMRSQYFHPIINFPDRIDQLLEQINKVYIYEKHIYSICLFGF